MFSESDCKIYREILTNRIHGVDRRSVHCPEALLAIAAAVQALAAMDKADIYRAQESKTEETL